MSYRRLIILLCLVLACSGQLAALRFARWNTSMGSFTAELYDHLVPITANNFISLANSGFYNELIFHRVVHGFVIQDGCPYGTGYGGPGYTIPDEFHPDLNHNEAGILAMARTSAPNSAGSQYYFTLAPAPHLNGGYAVFGKCIQGLDVIMAIGNVPVDANNRPLTPVTIDTLRILDMAITNLTPANDETIECSANEEQFFIVEASSQTYPITYRWFVDGAEQPGFSDFIFGYSFGIGSHTVSCGMTNADWAHTVTWDLNVQATYNSDPEVPSPTYLTLSPNPFKEGTRVDWKSPSNDDLSIYDLKGRLIRKISGASGSFVWDGSDSRGNRCPAGIYLFKAGERTEKGLLLK